jgi:hypothetical protein
MGLPPTTILDALDAGDEEAYLRWREAQAAPPPGARPSLVEQLRSEADDTANHAAGNTGSTMEVAPDA